jgi:hypothetical protein
MTSILSDSQAEIHTKLEESIPKVMACLKDDNSEVQKAALNAIRSLVQHCESR